MTQRQMTLKDVCGYDVRKLHRLHMSEALLADNVDTTLRHYNICGVHWIARSVSQPRKTCTADALFLCGSRAFYRTMHFSAKRGIAIVCRLSVCPSVRND